ncbi:MAG: antibiotic biosynthesis monooxygenase [candidate division Zixibacteria bacterium]|nr:antibiotic biosynthesis monooxygenase [candidate division Zixibacteria bacterium]
MIQLHIYLDVEPGKEKALEETYRNAYVPAIVVQDGYVSTALIKSMNGMRRYQIDIAFETEEKRLHWVASKEHQEAWPSIDALCHTITWQGFDVIA